MNTQKQAQNPVESMGGGPVLSTGFLCFGRHAMIRDDYYEKPEPKLEPGQEICSECGRIIEHDETRKCVNCGLEGCVHCMKPSKANGATGEKDCVCGPECDLEWIDRMIAVAGKRQVAA